MLMPTSADKHYQVGCLLVVDAYGRMDNPTQTAKPTHICVENVEPNTKSTVLVFPITPDMIFEAPVLSNAHNIKLGTKIGFAYNEHNCAYTLTGSTTNGVATVVYNLDYATNGNKIRVRFE